MSDAINGSQSAGTVVANNFDADIQAFGLTDTLAALQASGLSESIVRGMIQAAIGAKRAEKAEQEKAARADKRTRIDALVADFALALADVDFVKLVGEPLNTEALVYTMQLTLHTAYGVAEKPAGKTRSLSIERNGTHRGVYPHGLYRSPEGVEFRIGGTGYASMSAAFMDIGGEKKSGWAIRRFNTESVRIAD